jgi:hypothetical protein
VAQLEKNSPLLWNPKIWRVGINILNKQSRTTDKERSSMLGVARGLKSLHRKKSYVTKCYTGRAYLKSGRIK